jgi:hypothetical protein
VFLTFVLTFITSRVVTFLIMAHRIPDIYLHLGGTHVHHLNYGIFLLAGVGAFLLFAPESPELASMLGLAAFAPPLRSWRPRHVTTALITLAAVLIFFLLLAESFRFAAREQPRFDRLQEHAPR